MLSKLERLGAYRGDEPTNCPTLNLQVGSCPTRGQGLERLREIMRGVRSVPAPQWHGDAAESWEPYLPAWFVDGMRGPATAEIMTRPEQWHYKSWVAATADQQWAWWGAAATASCRRVTILGFGSVYNFGPLTYILRVSCGLNGRARARLREDC